MSKNFKVKKLILVWATSTLVISASKKAQAAKNIIILGQILYIYYLAQFEKDNKIIRALIDFGSKINIIIPVYIFKLDLKVWKTDVRTQKINSLSLATYKMVFTSF